jgi:putative intracellular protease/amidase
MVVSAADRWTLADGTTHPTGFWAEEVVEPHRVFSAAGWDITVATPGGRPPTVDRKSLRGLPGAGHRLTAYLDRIAGVLAAPLNLGAIDPADFDVVFYPGGHGPMEDLAVDPVSGALLTSVLTSGRPLALLCHAPAAAFAAHPVGGRWPFAGYRMTALSNREERFNRFARKASWLVETRLREQGARYERGPVPFAPYVVVDRNLYTGQNPASSGALARRLVGDMGAPLLNVRVSRFIAAEAATLYGLVSDVTSVGGRSPETTRARWTEPGRRFRAANRIGPLYRWSTTCTVTEAVPNKVFAFDVAWPSLSSWRYEFTETDGGTLVTESMTKQGRQMASVRAFQRLVGVPDRAEHLRAGMETTLRRLSEQAAAHG